ncbi:MAG: DUF4835 family protein [Bacteroidia bacterium]|nr:DUF4835 family protein [Bacteroidia bacterium]
MMPRFILLLILICPAGMLSAQELLCNVTVDASRIQSDKAIFEDMRQNIANYLNLNRWSNDIFEGHERIRCNLQIVVTDRPSPDYFTCNATLQVYRLAYNSTYETLIANLNDQDFNFRYVAYQQLQFADNAYNDNLTALLSYYAFLTLGLDYACMAPNGGLPYFRKAQEIVNLASGAAVETGWRANQDTRNKYWIIENLMNTSYKPYHTLMYRYHRQGLDQMESNPEQARVAILESVRDLQKLYKINPLLPLLKIFLDAKDDELVSVFKNAFINDKKAFVEIMQDVDPSNMARYNSVME